MDLSIIFFIVILISACWGSFLSATAYRITFDKPLLRLRSHCTQCDHIIAWYDNIPLISWILLKGLCRHCKQPISMTYPFVEFSTMIIMSSLFLKFYNTYYIHLTFRSFTTMGSLQPIVSFLSYAFFFSALIMATATDLRALVIPQLFTVWIIPVGVACAAFRFITISPIESMIGTMLGYGSLWLTALIFKRITHREGLGIGDMELLGMIGSFLGPLGVWVTLMLGSVMGSLIGGLYLLVSGKSKNTRIPFGPFLALGAVIYFFFETSFVQFLIP